MNPRRTEPQVRLPLAPLVAVMVGASAAVAGLWSVLFEVRSWRSLLAGIGITLAMALLSLLILGPWAKREMGAWMSRWLGAMVFRMLGTPLAALLLYSAASPLHRDTFWLGMAVTYVAVLFAETAVLALVTRNRLADVSTVGVPPSATSNHTPE